MDFWTRMRETLDKGLDTSRDLYSRAREKAQDLTDRGILRFEINQLETEAEKLIAKLGSRTFEVLVHEGQNTLSRKTPGVHELIDEIEAVQARVKDKEASLAKLQQEGQNKPSGDASKPAN